MNISVNLKKKAVLFMAAVLAAVCVFAGSSVKALADTGTANADGVNVRSAAVNGELVGSLSKGDEVTVNDQTTGSDGNTWYQITFTFNGSEVTGYVRGDFLDVVADETEDTAEEEEETEDTETVETQEYAPVANDASYVVAATIPEELYPDGFSLTVVDYEGSEISALKANNADVYLIYVVNTDNSEDGKLVIYDMSKAELIPFIQFVTKDGFIILLNIPSEELLRVSDRYVQTTYTFDSGIMDALQLGQTDELVSSDVPITDYYYMYGVDQAGTYGWYVYDSLDGTIQRNTVNMQYATDGTVIESEDTSDSDFSITDIPFIILIAAGVVLLVLLIIIIVLAVRYHRLAELIDEDEDDENTDDKNDTEEDEISVTHIRTTRPRRGRRNRDEESDEPEEAEQVPYVQPVNTAGPAASSATAAAPVSAPAADTVTQTSAGGDTIDMYNSFSEALEKMAAQESATAGNGAVNAAPEAKPAVPVVQAVKEEPASAATSGNASSDSDDDDEDLEFL